MNLQVEGKEKRDQMKEPDVATPSSSQAVYPRPASCCPIDAQCRKRKFKLRAEIHANPTPAVAKSP